MGIQKSPSRSKISTLRQTIPDLKDHCIKELKHAPKRAKIGWKWQASGNFFTSEIVKLDGEMMEFCRPRFHASHRRGWRWHRQWRTQFMKRRQISIWKGIFCFYKHRNNALLFLSNRGFRVADSTPRRAGSESLTESIYVVFTTKMGEMMIVV